MILILTIIGSIALLLAALVATITALILGGRNCISWARDEFRAGRAVALVIRRSRHKPYPFYGLYRPLRWLLRTGWHVGVIRTNADNRMHHLTPSDEEHDAYWSQGQWAALRSLWRFKGEVKEGDHDQPDH